MHSRSAIAGFVEHYNHQRHHESHGNITPADVYLGGAETILRKRKKIKAQTIEKRRLLDRQSAAYTATATSQSLLSSCGPHVPNHLMTDGKTELLIRGGHNIEPKPSDEAVCGHPSVAIAAAVGRSDAHAGGVLVLYV